MENTKSFRASKFKKEKGIYKKFNSLTDNKWFILILIMISAPLWIPILLASFIVVVAFYIVVWCLNLLFSGLCIASLILGVTGLIGIPFNSEVYYLISQSGISFLSLGLGLLFSILAVEIIKVAAKLSSLTTKHVINFIKY
ncbi:hypothetical protein [Vagococcus carniphilus]|uniref:Uncharacterized protein n=1 Tax=Vagococcus carniphilus TaxID=218144 RepID=A0A430B670_9ENTE|nr:hypothetical protein [Vagococcus carniphilus]QNN72682.1 hypothetical protein H9L18_12585 [Vagococcus carniphilus]RSU15788.1 hypothetical protein CBF28_04960 [Vagococcus carniphilus]